MPKNSLIVRARDHRLSAAPSDKAGRQTGESRYCEEKNLLTVQISVRVKEHLPSKVHTWLPCLGGRV